MKLHIVIPIYISDSLHYDFTKQTLESIKTTHQHQTTLINNYTHKSFTKDLKKLTNKNTQILDNPKGNALSAAWNVGIDTGLAKHADYMIIANNDIIFHPFCLDNLVSYAQKHPTHLLWTASVWPDLRSIKNATITNSDSPHPHFSLFMINKKTIDEIGYFDENLTPAYFEDNDYHIRILLAGKKAVATDSAKFYHFGSRTTVIDDDVKVITKRGYQKNRFYMIDKWGIDLHDKAYSPPEKILEDIFTHPFNDEKMSLKDWPEGDFTPFHPHNFKID